MTPEEALEERHKIRQVVKNWRAKDAWHDAVRDRYWEMPPIPEGVEP